MNIQVKIGETTFPFAPIAEYRDLEIVYRALEYQIQREGQGVGEEKWDWPKQYKMYETLRNIESLVNRAYQISLEEHKIIRGEITERGRRRKNKNINSTTFLEENMVT